MRPTVTTYNALMDIFIKNNQINSSLQCLEYMRNDGLRPDVATMNTLLDGLLRLVVVLNTRGRST